ncbi:MAG: hypothetical protein F6K04_26940, partial [Leptolyngbya sp. SIO4C5]|nr:hypothetical protein [Leptolyngbya sp. SIO4C5]
ETIQLDRLNHFLPEVFAVGSSHCQVTVSTYSSLRPNLIDYSYKVLKYFLLSLAGLTIAHIAAIALEFTPIANLIVTFLEQLLTRGSVLMGCLVAIAAIVESLRH